MNPSDPFARALSTRSTLPSELSGLDSDPLWAALLTSVQNVVLGEIRAARYPELADESQRERWPEALDRLGDDARVRVGREIVDELAAGTVDELWVVWMRVVGQAGTPGDPTEQKRLINLLDVLGEIVDRQLAERFGVLPNETRPEPIEFSLSDAGPAPERVVAEPPAPPVAPDFTAPIPAAAAGTGLVASLPPALAQPPARPAAVPVFDWAPSPSHPDAEPAETPAGDTVSKAPAIASRASSPPRPEAPTAPAYPEPNGYSVPPGAPGWRPLPPTVTGRTPATVGRRAAAFLIDRAITIVITTAAVLLFVWPAVAFTSSSPRPAAGGLLIALAFVGVAVVSIGWFLVVAWLTGTRGASPGKRIMRIEVVGFSSPGPIGFGRALLRELILAAFTIGSVLTAWLPYASVFWDSTKQLRGWHDRAVDDIVVDAAAL